MADKKPPQWVTTRHLFNTDHVRSEQWAEWAEEERTRVESDGANVDTQRIYKYGIAPRIETYWERDNGADYLADTDTERATFGDATPDLSI